MMSWRSRVRPFCRHSSSIISRSKAGGGDRVERGSIGTSSCSRETWWEGSGNTTSGIWDVVETTGRRFFSQRLTTSNHCTGSLPLTRNLIHRRTSFSWTRQRGSFGVLWCKREEVLKEAVQRLQEARDRVRTGKDPRDSERRREDTSCTRSTTTRADEAVTLSRSAMHVLPPFLSLPPSL